MSGSLTLLDADKCDQAGYNPYNDFMNVYTRTLGCVRVYTVYEDDDHEFEHSDAEHTMADYEWLDLVLDEWTVWT